MENLFRDTDANLETVHGKHLNNERLKLGGLFLHYEMTSIVDFRSVLCFELTMQLTRFNDIVPPCWSDEVCIA